MEVFKETKYLAFVIAPTEKKTLTVAIINRHHQEIIGEIKWFAKWRQYVSSHIKIQCGILLVWMMYIVSLKN